MRLPPPPPPAPVLGLYAMRDAGAYYRVVVPLRAIGGAWACYDEVTAAHLDAAETVILYRLGGHVADVAATVADLRQRWGVRTVLVDYDDAMFSPHPIIEVRVPPLGLAGVRAGLAAADGVIVQNAALVRHFRAQTDRPVAIVPNLIAAEDWPAPTPPAWPPTVVLAGSPSHRLDWDEAIPALTWLRAQVPAVRVRRLGCPHPALKLLATEGGDWQTDLGTYAASLAGGAIGLCPLPDAPFNRGKSPVKAYEYSLAAGMAVIGSPTQYGDVLADGRGIVVADGDALGWARALDAYLSDGARRAADAARLRAWVLAERDVRRHVSALRDTYLTHTEGSTWRLSRVRMAS